MKRQGTRRPVRTLLGAAAAVAIAVISLAGSTPAAATNDAADQAKAKHYKATRAYVVDKETGAVRMPTQQEVDEVVGNLSALGQRPAENLQQTPQSNGAVAVDLDGGFGGVLLGPAERRRHVGDEVRLHARRGRRIPRPRRRHDHQVMEASPMTTIRLHRSTRALILALAALVVSAGAASAGPAQFVIVNINAPGVGFNDPTPAAPVGGNTGTTLGQQRLIAFEHAATHLERAARQRRADPHPRAVHAARRRASSAAPAR